MTHRRASLPPAPARLGRRTALAGIAALPLLAAPALSASRRYVLDRSGTRVGFIFRMSGLPQRGEIPINRADIQLDTNRLAASTVSVQLDARRAETPTPFARDAMRSPLILDVEQFPTITFKSKSVQLGADGRISNGARITGDLTLRGVTRPITLNAALYRAPGSAADDLERLSIQLGGALSRSAFGATGYPALVADEVQLDIKVQIRAT